MFYDPHQIQLEEDLIMCIVKEFVSLSCHSFKG
jgi:hypothetical protein